MKRTPWTPNEVGEFIETHEARMAELGYPHDLVLELRRARRRWLEGVVVKA